MALALIMSFILHGVTLYALILLYKKQQLGQMTPEELAQQKAEIEDLLMAYTTEIKDENDKLLNKMNRQQMTSAPADLSGKKVDQPVDEPLLKATLHQSPANKREENETKPTYVPPLPNEEEQYETSIEMQALKMYKEGYTVTDIAKKLKKGKGEVELMVKFHR